MNDHIAKVKESYRNYWRQIPQFPLYDMNLLGEVRDAQLRQLVSRMDRRTYVLYDGREWIVVSAKDLYENTFPFSERPPD